MNKHIQKLINEADRYALDKANNADDEDYDFTYDDDLMEKFAELIIKECAGVYEAIDNGNKVEGTDNYVLALRRRFEL